MIVARFPAWSVASLADPWRMRALSQPHSPSRSCLTQSAPHHETPPGTGASSSWISRIRCSCASGRSSRPSTNHSRISAKSSTRATAAPSTSSSTARWPQRLAPPAQAAVVAPRPRPIDLAIGVTYPGFTCPGAAVHPGPVMISAQNSCWQAEDTWKDMWGC